MPQAGGRQRQEEPGGPLSAAAPDELMYVDLDFYNCHIHALVDSGASKSVLRRREFDILCKLTGRTPIVTKGVELYGVTGHGLKVLGSTQLRETSLGPIPVIIVEDINHALILGRDVLKAHKAHIDYENGVLSWQDHRLDLLPQRCVLTIDSFGTKPPLMSQGIITRCVEAHEHLFSAKGEHLGCHPDIMVRIETEGGPIKRRPYRLPLKKREALNEILDELLEQGVIVPSSSPWASPVVLVGKKDPADRMRLCIDFTKLNALTKKDAYPIPLIRDIFDQLQGATVFSTLDLKSGFHQLPLHPDDQEKTAFVCHRGLFQWTRLAMGLANASQAFQRAMEVVLKGLIGSICMLYIDDVVIYSCNEEEHAEHLKTIFERFDRYNLRLNPAKCVFGLREVKLLGFIVSAAGLRADPAKVTAITRMQAPQNLAEARSFLGMTGYYRQCIKDYAKISQPLVHLTKKHVRFEWKEPQQTAFEQLKDALVSDHVMAHPKTNEPYFLYTDACDYAIGGILCQKDDEGVERPVVYLSKQLSDTQKRWATIEKEAYAVIYALKQLRPYLWGAQYRTFTDHKPLTSLFTKDMNNTKIQRWAVLLAEYNCRVEYHKGKLNIRADMLSRIRQHDDISTFDVGYWQLGDQIPNLPACDSPPDIYGLDLKQIAQQQKLMTEWTEHRDEDSDYVIINGLLYSTRRPFKYAPDHPRLVLPKDARQIVVQKAHKEVGHMSTVKTMRKLQEAFAWPGMKADVSHFVSRCPTCLAHSQTAVRAPMGEMPIATAPIQIIAADLIGPLPTTPSGNQYILTMIDHCTGWAEAYPIASKTSQAVWNRFTRDFFPRHGYPDTLLTDLGLEFGAHALRDYLEAVGIDHRRTTCYNPQANGKCERFNGTLKRIITRLTNNDRGSWEDQLGPALLAYNNSVSDVTWHTPYFLHYGRRARLPLSKLMNNNGQLLDKRLDDVAAALRIAAAETAHSRHHNRERLAKRANTQDLKVGDTVVIKANEPLSLTSKWDPQWTITRVKGKVISVSHQQSGRRKTLNINKVKLVDPNIAWDEVNPRPIRNPRLGARQPNPAPPNRPAPPRGNRLAPPAVHTQVTNPGGSQPQRPAKRRRANEHDVTADKHRRTGQANPGRAGPQQTTAYKQPANDGASQQSQRLNQQPRPSTSASTTKRPTDPIDPEEVPTKRARPYLPRGVKRPLPEELIPTPEQQKRARIVTISLVKHFLASLCTTC